MEDRNRRATDQLFSPFFAEDSPWWWKAVIQILFWFGPTIVVAMVFLGMFTGVVPSPITENNRMLHRVESKLDAAIIDMKREVQTDRNWSESMVRLQLQTCRNVAKSPIEVIRCEDYWRR